MLFVFNIIRFVLELLLSKANDELFLPSNNIAEYFIKTHR